VNYLVVVALSGAATGGVASAAPVVRDCRGGSAGRGPLDGFSATMFPRTPPRQHGVHDPRTAAGDAVRPRLDIGRPTMRVQSALNANLHRMTGSGIFDASGNRGAPLKANLPQCEIRAAASYFKMTGCSGRLHQYDYPLPGLVANVFRQPTTLIAAAKARHRRPHQGDRPPDIADITTGRCVERRLSPLAIGDRDIWMKCPIPTRTQRQQARVEVIGKKLVFTEKIAPLLALQRW